MTPELAALATDPETIDAVPLERVEEDILGLAGSLAAGEAALLGWLASYDRRQGWSTWGCKSAAHWLSWKCGDSLHTARERVRVARALEALPLLAAAFADGTMSYSKVRAITRIATAADEHVWLGIAEHETGAGLDRIVASVAAVDRGDDNAAVAWRNRRVETVRPPRPAQARIVTDLPIDGSRIVMAALDTLASQVVDAAVAGSGESRRDVIAARGGLAAIRADVLVELAERAVAAAGVSAERGDVGRLALVVEPEVLAGDSDHGECSIDEIAVPPEVARRWACDTRVEPLEEHRCGLRSHRHGRDVGRASAVVPRRLRRAVLRRDHGRCRFPGCGATSWLHMHHIQPWHAEGETVLDNLVSLCGFHHHLIHEGGWALRLLPDMAVEWVDGEGRTMTIDQLPGGTAVSLPPGRLHDGWSGPVADFAFAVDVVADEVRRARDENVPAGTPGLRSSHDRHTVAGRRRWPRGGLSSG